jgi:GNAT superfamily N-acetyltransferase
MMNPNIPEITLAPFRPEDQAAAKALVLEGLAEHWGWLDPSLNPDLNDISESYAQGAFVLARIAGTLVGTGALIPEGEDSVRVVRMSVARAWRRHGIASRILAALLDEARARGCRQVVLETTSTWQDATGFYLRHGFQIIGHWDGDTHFVLDLQERES